jgi:hypothetical protein
MTSRARMKAIVAEERAAREAAAPKPLDDSATPAERLMHAADNGEYETLVATARPAQPIAMVTPEEREAELRAADRWEPDPTEPEPPQEEAEPEPERELTPNEQYIAEHCHWRRRGPGDSTPTHREGQYLTEYDVITGELIGDGYIEREEHDDDDRDGRW